MLSDAGRTVFGPEDALPGALATKYGVTEARITSVTQAREVWQWFDATFVIARGWSSSLTADRDALFTVAPGTFDPLLPGGTRQFLGTPLPPAGTAQAWVVEVQYLYQNQPFGQMSQPGSVTVRG